MAAQPAFLCPNCGTVLVPVKGHYDCPKCRVTMIGCCEGAPSKFEQDATQKVISQIWSTMNRIGRGLVDEQEGLKAIRTLCDSILNQEKPINET